MGRVINRVINNGSQSGLTYRDSQLAKTGYKHSELAPVEDNYIYISHLDKDYRFWRIPSTPAELSDNFNSSFQQATALGRSAPVFTYSNSGPRTVNISISLHRDLMDDLNKSWSNSTLGYGEDYIDNLIRALQSIAVPRYNLNNKAVEPPLVAVRFDNDIFIKGVVNGSIAVTYKGPILANNKRALVDISFTVSEVDPFDASTVFTNGAFRGVVRTLRDGMGLNSK